MTEVVEDLAAWLTAVWDEEEEIALTAAGWDRSGRKRASGQWVRSGISSVEDDERRSVIYSDAGQVSGSVADHVARNDPASVLARIAADRKILAAWRYESNGDYAMGDGGADSGLLFALKCKALAHSERPGWQADWDPRDCRHCKPYKERHAYNLYCKESAEWLVERQGVEQ